MMIDGEEKTVIVDRMSYLANHITNNLIKEEGAGRVQTLTVILTLEKLLQRN